VTTDIIDRLRGIGLCAGRDALQAFLTHATKSRLSAAEVLEQIAELERRERDAKNLAARTKRATLGAMKAIDRFDWSFPRVIDRALYERLLTLDFTKVGHNVIFRGPSGVGKTTLAQNLGQRALEKGKSVRFATVNEALADLLKQESIPAFERRLRRYTAPELLCLDELGYLPCDARSGDLLYSIISRRHQRASTVITTNLAFKQWGTVFPGAACVVALVDRFTEHCHVVDIDGESWRQRENQESDTPSDEPPRLKSPARLPKRRRAR
jgi:DNA replication protein DnaC